MSGLDAEPGTFSPVVACVMFESIEDPDSVGSYYQDYGSELADWLAAGCPSSLVNVQVTVRSEYDWSRAPGTVLERDAF